MNDSEFVQRLREKDPAAVGHLTECFLPSIWRFVYFQVSGDRHLAEDIVSEAVLALVRAAEDGSAIQNPAGWLRSVARHKVQDHFRAAARIQHLIDQAKHTQDSADENDAVKQQELVERRSQIRQVMDELPERHRLALEWKYVDKLSVREIAVRLETTEKSVESVLFRARREFRQKLQEPEAQHGSKKNHLDDSERNGAGRQRFEGNGQHVSADEPESAVQPSATNENPANT